MIAKKTAFLLLIVKILLFKALLTHHGRFVSYVNSQQLKAAFHLVSLCC